MVIEVQGLVKRYGDLVAVDNLSFEVGQGEIFGLLGPNGAGKTTTIRVILDIFQPDAGQVRVFGLAPRAAKDRIGYLPEERGLFRNLKVLDTLIYLAQLKGRGRAWARERALRLLERVELEEWAGRKVRDLSRGMQQRLQFVASIVHDPALVFLDEPFQGQDPLNVERMRGLISDLRREGTTIVLSSHQMNLVEALCDRILLIDHGRAVLYGPLSEIKRRYAPNVVRVRAPALPAGITGVVKVEADDRADGALNLTLEEGCEPRALLRALLERGVELEAFEVAPAPLADIFVAVVSGRAPIGEGR